MTFVGKKLNVEKNIILSELSQTQKDQLWYVFEFIWIFAVMSLIDKPQSMKLQRVCI